MTKARILPILLAIASAAGATAPAQGNDEYSFDWLDPEKKIYVLQNRKYLKTNRPVLSLMIGPGLTGAYQNRFNLDPRLAYYINESWGIEGFYTKSFNTENSDLKALKNATTTLPLIREVQSQLGILVHWVPWYAKINVFNSILYFDWYFSGGLGSIGTGLDTRASSTAPANIIRQDFFALYLGTGHQYHLSEHFLVRLDFMGSYYSAPLFGNTGESTWFSNYNFSFGVGLRL